MSRLPPWMAPDPPIDIGRTRTSRVCVPCRKEPPRHTMQFKNAMLAVLALCLPAAPAVALAAPGTADSPKTTTKADKQAAAVARARAQHVALHRRAARRNVRLARIKAYRLGHALAASYRHTARTASLEDLQRSNERLRAQIDRINRENDLVERLRPTLAAIARCESHHIPTAVSASGKYRGLFQFDATAWAAAGGEGDPAAASTREQYVRAAITYMRRGASPWPICGRRA